jgi:hypothetical protein
LTLLPSRVRQSELAATWTTDRRRLIRNLISPVKDFRFSESTEAVPRQWLNLSNTPRFAVSGIGNTQGNSNRPPQTTLPGTARNVQFAPRFMF